MEQGCNDHVLLAVVKKITAVMGVVGVNSYSFGFKMASTYSAVSFQSASEYLANQQINPSSHS